MERDYRAERELAAAVLKIREAVEKLPAVNGGGPDEEPFLRYAPDWAKVEELLDAIRREAYEPAVKANRLKPRKEAK